MKICKGCVQLLHITSYNRMYWGNVMYSKCWCIANFFFKLIRKDTDSSKYFKYFGQKMRVLSHCLITQMDQMNIYLLMTNTQTHSAQCWCFQRQPCGTGSDPLGGKKEEKEQSATLTEFTNFLNHKRWCFMSAMEKVRKVWKILAKAQKLKIQWVLIKSCAITNNS